MRSHRSKNLRQVVLSGCVRSQRWPLFVESLSPTPVRNKNHADASCSCGVYLRAVPDLRIDEVVQSFGPILIEVLQDVVLLNCAVAIAKREL